MPRVRFSIGGMMGVVVVCAVGTTAMREHSEPWAGGLLLLTCGILALAIVGVVAGRGTRRIWWLGFSLFGWGYLALSRCGEAEPSSALPTARVLEVLGERLGIPLEPRGVAFSGCMISPGLEANFAQIGHCLWAFLASLAGGALAIAFFAPRECDTESVRAEAGEVTRRRGRWMPPAIMGFVALILVGAIATARFDDGAPLWAGITFALTCAFSGMAILGAILARGQCRARWLGAAFFGAGYTALVFSQPVGHPRAHFATDPILKGLWAQFAPLTKHVFPANARILEALDQPVPMHFPDETPLADLLDYIKQATSTPTHPGIPIYVDPIGLQEAERSMSSTVQIDLEGVPLRETLRLCLKELGLVYEVEHDYLRIFSEDGYEDRSPGPDDPDLVVGHCLLALLASAVGAAAGPIVAGTRAGSVGAE